MPQEYITRCIAQQPMMFAQAGTRAEHWLMTLGERIRAARKHAQLTQVQLAGRVGITQQVLARLERDGASSTKALALIAVECCVSPRWLATGEGEMLDATPDMPAPIQLTQRELALIANYRAGDDSARALLERQALNLAQQAPKYGRN